jgi:hypothetical protein
VKTGAVRELTLCGRRCVKFAVVIFLLASCSF